MKATGITNPDFISTCAVMILLAHGFILTAMLWGGAVAFLIDRQGDGRGDGAARLLRPVVLRVHPLGHAHGRDLPALATRVDAALSLGGRLPLVRAADSGVGEDEGVRRKPYRVRNVTATRRLASETAVTVVSTPTRKAPN